MALDVAQIYCLRERLASAILFKLCVSHIRKLIIKLTLHCFPTGEKSTRCPPIFACILSYDGLPAMVSSNDLSLNQGSNQNSEEVSRLSQGRVVGYIPPDDFFMRLLADKPHSASSFQKTTGCKNRSSLDALVNSNSRAAQKINFSNDGASHSVWRARAQVGVDLENAEHYPEIDVIQITKRWPSTLQALSFGGDR
ncbi:unnamed protein product [Miscanthus lutarioriparius]|uniref:Uncharacterized protein n=1 Tax=Miscanthus lutarioriparius TaxID=422564 RepID=A0A811NUT5_9POAL|nr:unnamed protein product [Miscanthus lutarioriparius]